MPKTTYSEEISALTVLYHKYADEAECYGEAMEKAIEMAQALVRYCKESDIPVFVNIDGVAFIPASDEPSKWAEALREWEERT